MMGRVVRSPAAAWGRGLRLSGAALADPLPRWSLVDGLGHT